MQSRRHTRILVWLAAASTVAVASLFLSRGYLHMPLVFFPFFLVWSWGGRRSEMCRERPEYGTCAPYNLMVEEDERG